jgi:NAD(P)-dependent dehydrogenase (short-subunit alcohol dehydrogenase family)
VGAAQRNSTTMLIFQFTFSRGIGLETVRYLARAGAKVYLACRSESAAAGAIQELQSAGLTPGNGELVYLKLDLNDPEEAKRAAEEFLKLESRLDVLGAGYGRCFQSHA